MIETKKATTVYAFSDAYKDPGLLYVLAEIPQDSSLEEGRRTLIETTSEIAEKVITDGEVERVKVDFLRRRDQEVANSSRLAVSLSEWAAQGDWRLFFLHRDRIEKVTAEDVNRVAKEYLVRNNRTVGLFIPTDKPQSVTIAATPSVKSMLENYRGRKSVAAGEQFDPSPKNIDARTENGTIEGIKASFLAKKTRGETVYLLLSLRYGNGETLVGRDAAGTLLPTLMTRGTKNLSYLEFQDELSKNGASLTANGFKGLASFRIQTKKKDLINVLGLLKQVLREPTLSEEEFETLRKQYVTSYESQQADPQALAGIALKRVLNPQPTASPHYVPTIEETIKRYEDVTLEEIRTLYDKYLSSQAGELTLLGDFYEATVRPILQDMLGDWTSDIKFARMPNDANDKVTGGQQAIKTPGKANAVYLAGINFPMRDDDPQYAALVIGNFILGGGSLSSRLADRVRQQEGLSYGIRSSIDPHPIDKRCRFSVYAITNPDNRDKLVSVINEELERILEGGITQDELDRAQQGYLQAQGLQRSGDRSLAGTLNGNLFAGRSMKYQEDFEAQVQSLTVDQVNSALRSYIDTKRLNIVTAGDFK